MAAETCTTLTQGNEAKKHRRVAFSQLRTLPGCVISPGFTTATSMSPGQDLILGLAISRKRVRCAWGQIDETSQSCVGHFARFFCLSKIFSVHKVLLLLSSDATGPSFSPMPALLTSPSSRPPIATTSAMYARHVTRPPTSTLPLLISGRSSSGGVLLVWNASNLGGHAKKVTVNALTLVLSQRC
ncbi:hypothetical protein AYL99_11620 [Fonsecaea erecta]|uniref:Uncharacterized protein n=1 Tax=Fonsecaea erecta TaxID=1367422 RepID=A0A178Z3N6_9EURO|nr:hypothetical protein AYL99_11620 [Fonsecaea erecta]OAP54086.1 hypothetical protein AYL99_11620 [Fonsecaea erecta]